MLCTEQFYDERKLTELAKLDFKLEYRNSYIDLISTVIKELLIEKRVNRLQTFGYRLVPSHETQNQYFGMINND